MKQVELIEKRKPREKHFLQPDGTIIAELYDEDVHFLKNGKYEEIDNKLIKIGNCFINKSNSFTVLFNNDDSEDLMKLCKDTHYIDIKLKQDGKKLNKKIKQEENKITYNDIFENISIEYNVLSSKIKETIIIKDKINIPSNITFSLDTDLLLNLNDDKSISAFKDNNEIFIIEAPYMVDSNNNINDNVYYKFAKSRNGYDLTLILDTNWLNDNETAYPVTIDPTISSQIGSNSVYDTYIYQGDTNDIRYNRDILKAGVEKVNNVDRINRTLLKFNLPNLGTGSQVLDATITLITYPKLNSNGEWDTVTAHKITSDWTESGATWELMNDKYDENIETCFNCARSILNQNGSIEPYPYDVNITNLVKKWYTGEPNYGIMLKQYKEVYHHEFYPAFFSKDNTVSGYNPKPILKITYRNQNGIESYMSYRTQKYPSGTVYINNYNGNLTFSFNVGKTKGSKLLPSLSIIYNTNDLVLQKNYGYGVGYKFNLHQTLKEISIDNISCLEYVDSDSTIHYFMYNDNIYKDEDGLNLTISKTDTKCEMSDKFGNVYEFSKESVTNTYYLTKVTDSNDNCMNIIYNSSNQIVKVIDEFSQEINITYSSNIITIVDDFETINLFFSNDSLTSIVRTNGSISFNYSNGLITKIIDNNKGTCFGYEYYPQSPYKVKKIIEYGLNEAVGKSISYEYGFDSTTMTDNRNRVSTIIFNSQGGISCVTNLKDSNDISNAYGKHETYGKEANEKNQLLSIGFPSKYIKNYIFGSSLEDRDSSEGQNKIFTPQEGINLSISSDYSYLGDKSLKAICTQNNSSMNRTIDVHKGNYYTFSAYFKTTCPFKIGMGYITSENELVEEQSEIFNSLSEFERKEFSYFYPTDAYSELAITIYLLSTGTMYLDCAQLEEGQVANNYNLMDNSDFSIGKGGWNFLLSSTDPSEQTEQEITSLFDEVFQVVNIDNNTAIKVAMKPPRISAVKKEICVNGSSGDLYNVSFWYKNSGVTKSNIYTRNDVSIDFLYDNIEPSEEEETSLIYLNPNSDNWQYFSYTFVAEDDYHGINILFNQQFNAGDLYITNITVSKDLREAMYEYDEQGNIVLVKGLDNKTQEISYNSNNQFMRLVDKNNKSYAIEYDKYKVSLPLREITTDGLIHETHYNEQGISVATRNRIVGAKEVNSGLYYIRIAGTNKYINFNGSSILHIGNSKHDIWMIDKSNEQLYSIRHSILQAKYFKDYDDQVLLSNGSQDNHIFNLIENKDFSYYIKLNGTNKYVKYDNTAIVLAELDENDISFKFYFEQSGNKKIIENSFEYDASQRYVTNVVGAALDITSSNINMQTGLVDSVTNTNGRTKEFIYNSNNNISKIESGDRNVMFQYNSLNKVENIISGDMNYKFEYDDFQNINKIKVGNNITLVEKVFENNNGNEISNIFGNGDTINYEYDEFDRMSKIIKMDKTVNYKYNNAGKIAKIISDDSEIVYDYNLAQKLSNYIDGLFSIKYSYNNKNIISSRTYKLGNIINNVVSNYDDNDELLSIEFSNNRVDYLYDEFSRLISKKINNTFDITYEYVNYGNRCTTLLNKMTYGQDTFSYKYDKAGNITHIYMNNILNNKYYYNEYNELIREDDYLLRITTRYKYDKNGNILSRIQYNLNTFEVKKSDKYLYNNVNWSDQLSSYNGTNITYDAIGNITEIGNNITLSWINGKELQRYTNTNRIVDYYYNALGIRNKKVVNGIVTNYSIEGNRIVFEQCGNNTISYIYSDLDNLIGFIYNNSKYFYLKNATDDIIGIIDENNSVCCYYKYDSWGKIISVTNASGVPIAYNANNIAYINPFRYRSYYFDEETGLYYLKSRYYNPEWGRFISSDANVIVTDDVRGYNMYAYAYNNPINYTDTDGKASIRSRILNSINKFCKEVYNFCCDFVNAVENAFNYLVSNTVINTYNETNYNIIETPAANISVNITNTTSYGSPTDRVSISADIKDDFSKANLTINMNSLHGNSIASASVSKTDAYVKYGPATFGCDAESMSCYISAEFLRLTHDNQTTTVEIREDINVIFIAGVAIVCVASVYCPEVLIYLLSHAQEITEVIQELGHQLQQAPAM